MDVINDFLYKYWEYFYIGWWTLFALTAIIRKNPRWLLPPLLWSVGAAFYAFLLFTGYSSLDLGTYLKCYGTMVVWMQKIAGAWRFIALGLFLGERILNKQVSGA